MKTEFCARKRKKSNAMKKTTCFNISVTMATLKKEKKELKVYKAINGSFGISCFLQHFLRR